MHHVTNHNQQWNARRWLDVVAKVLYIVYGDVPVANRNTCVITKTPTIRSKNYKRNEKLLSEWNWMNLLSATNIKNLRL